jgi:hypothetical protein
METISLGKPSVLDGGFLRGSYPIKVFDLRTEINHLLIKKGFIDGTVPLEDLHLYLRQEDLVYDENGLINVSKGFFETSGEFRQIYFQLMKYIAEHYFDFDFIFQETPTIRFLVPGRFTDKLRSKDGVILDYHSDTLLGHPFEEINCWLPLTRCHGTNALQLCSLADGIKALTLFCEDINFSADIYHSGRELFVEKMKSNVDYQRFIVDSCKPVPMDTGEVIFFDPRCLHGPAENKERHTRVSLDFRLVPVDAYNKITRLYQSQGRTRRMFSRGDVYSEKSVREL